MTKYYPYGVSLSKGQMEKLSRAYNNNSAITIRLARNELSSPHELMLTKTQINKLRKAMSQGTGSDIKISKTQIRKAVRQGGSLWGSLINLGSKLLPMAMPLAKKAIAPLATGALSGLASLGVDKIFGKGQRGGFLIPQDKIAQLIAYKHLLSTGQKRDILNALQTGNGLVIRPTKTQQGVILLASIGVPLLLNALTGKGLQADRTGSANTTSVYVPDTTNGHGMYNPYPYMSPPFFGTWENPVGAGVKKKKKGKGTAARKKQPIQFNPNSRNNTVRFINKPLSNIDLLQWVKQLGIKYFRGIYSRDNLPDKIHKLETGIINLDDSMGGGSHWICYRNVDKQYCEYFDPFGLIMPNEIKNYLKTSGKKMVYSSDEIQERDSVLCGYWCLYYLLERQKGRSLLDVIHNPKFSFTNQMINHQFQINYFM